MQWYYNVLVRRPYLMVVFIAVLCIACIIVSLTTNNLPDFTDPTLGFETRGTEIGKRLIAWHNLLQETGPSNLLVADPNDLTLMNRAHNTERSEFDINGYPTITRKNKKRKNRRPKNRHKQRKENLKKKSNAELTKKLITFKERLKGKTSKKDPNDGEKNSTQSLSTVWHGDSGIFKDYEITNDTLVSSPASIAMGDHEIAYGRNMTFVDEDDQRDRIHAKKSTWSILINGNISEKVRFPIEGYFCDSPAKEYAHFVVERIGPNSTDSLFDLNGLLAMCQLQDQITRVQDYGEYCQRELISNNCCRPWSLSNYAALLANKSSCFDLTHDDVLLLNNLLSSCFEYFHDLKLSNDCSEINKCYAPLDCTRNNIVFNILHYLTDYNFIKINDTNIFLKYSMIFVPVPHSTKILPLFHEWEKVDLSNEIVRVAAMDLGLENELFNELLLTDAWLVALGGIFVMTCMWLYTTSVFVTLMTCIAVIFSLGLAYFIYTLVFEMTFFPYMNLLAVVVIIGIGADDAFIFVKIWQCVLMERFSKMSTVTTKSLTNTATDTEQTETLQNLMALTLKHASISMFVTSVTTAGAFYASYTSYITAIKCFGVFAGTAVITNYILMITWLPASISIMERLSSCTTCSKLQIQKILIMINKSINSFCTKLESFITTAILCYAPLWFSIFGILGICSAIVVLYKPGLQLPENSHFQLFVSKHPFEIYNSKLKNEFWFEKSMMNFENYKFSLRFVWGIQPIDDGDYANPYAYGNLHYDNNFNVSTKAAQIWLLSFCQNIRQQPFYQLTFGMLLPNCFIENFITLMQRMCVNEMDYSDRTPCCDISKFPYEPDVFDLCLPQIISSLYATPRDFFSPGVAGPRFMASTKLDLNVNNTLSEDFVNNTLDSTTNSTAAPPIVKALVIEFESNVSYSTVYDTVKEFIKTVEEWFQNELKTAPPEMQGGWFISELKFYDVQDTLPSGTLVAITVAMTASLVVLLLVTLNILISFYAVITVLLTIFVTVAILIVLGWKLNILESVTVSTAIGLAVDFSLHYGIHYRLSPSCERLAATQFSLSRIIGPTAMAAITTGIAGALMLFSNVLPYLQIGIFLLVVMTVSWTYATFFLMSLLKLFGPQYGFMQFQYPRVKKRSNTNGIKFYERKQNHVTREQLLTPSSSAVGELINSESHELESLTSNSMIKTISGAECSAQNFPMDYENLFNSKCKPLSSITSPIINHHHKCPAFIKENSTQQSLTINNITTTTTAATETDNISNHKLTENQI
ncbi:protein dispatched [Lucilia cuprina]|uniref:protein dispatched n=1 Tax=Lucilia cuprina TaxID=7375 RepID=UPI001F06B524|nr:protein dispatched [Lucilia cuprina]